MGPENNEQRNRFGSHDRPREPSRSHSSAKPFLRLRRNRACRSDILKSAPQNNSLPRNNRSLSAGPAVHVSSPVSRQQPGGEANLLRQRTRQNPGTIFSLFSCQEFQKRSLVASLVGQRARRKGYRCRSKCLHAPRVTLRLNQS